MRKLHQVALVVAAASGLSAIGVGPSVADVPVGYGSVPPPAGQQDLQATSWTNSQASAQRSNLPNAHRPAPATLPHHGADVTPQVNPQLSPKISPQVNPQPTAAPSGPIEQANLFRPYQECSPQSLLNAAVPVAVLAAAETEGVDCDQANSQANSLAHARYTR
ncbi:hypothetical protein [Streptomyces sp. NBC_01092]|uniref:hypothetical protein n=1 Tax=Streptomyces sp. NBC_01092 TaxID=2903748 RepID=UPI003862F1A2|nr:hypothetical protein OG254_22580 [Streptomyces sp. NBC_01092]